MDEHQQLSFDLAVALGVSPEVLIVKNDYVWVAKPSYNQVKFDYRDDATMWRVAQSFAFPRRSRGAWVCYASQHESVLANTPNEALARAVVKYPQHLNFGG
jgi:hypothetical protein